MLMQWFCERYAPGADLRVSNAAMKALMNYDWPGSRELENCIERAVALGDGTLIDLGDLPHSIAARDSPSSRMSSAAAPELGFPISPPPLNCVPPAAQPQRRSPPPISKISNAPPSSASSNSQRRQSPSRTHARHQPRHPLPQTKALQTSPAAQPPTIQPHSAIAMPV